MLPAGIAALQRHPELTAVPIVSREQQSALTLVWHICRCSEGLRRPLLARISVQQRSQRQGGEQDVQLDIEAGAQEEGGPDDENEQVPAQWLLARSIIRFAATDPACSQQMTEIASKLDLPRHQVLGNLCLQPNQPAVRSNLTMQLCLGLSGTQQPPSRHLPPAHVPRLHLSSCLGATCQTVRQTAAAPSR